MAKGTEIEPTNDTTDGLSHVGYDAAQFEGAEWETAHVEAGDQVTFDHVGDTLIGIYAGHELIYPDKDNPDPIKARKWFVQLRWTIPGGVVFTNAGHELTQAYCNVTLDRERTPTVTDKIPVGTMTQTVLMKFVDTGEQSEMKSYRVLTAKLNGNADNPA